MPFAPTLSDRLNNARRLRRDLTDVERKLWSRLRSRQLEGFKFRRQHPIGPYVADLICEEVKLIVELDGGQHNNSISDEYRTAFLQKEGYRVVRFWNSDIIENLEGVLWALRDALLNLSSLGEDKK